MDAAGIYSKLTIRLPSAAPFDCWISLFHRASSYAPCPRVNLPACPLAQALVPLSPCPHVPSRKRWPLATFGRVEVQRSKGTA